MIAALIISISLALFFATLYFGVLSAYNDLKEKYDEIQDTQDPFTNQGSIDFIIDNKTK